MLRKGKVPIYRFQLVHCNAVLQQRGTRTSYDHFNKSQCIRIFPRNISEVLIIVEVVAALTTRSSASWCVL